MRYFLLFSTVLTLLFHSTCLSASDTKLVTLDYTIDGVTSHIYGTRVQNTFVFNQNAERTVTLRTLDWPPYIDQHLCDFGWVFKYAVWVLVEQGYRVEIKFLPWVRAVREVEKGDADILFPEYYIEEQAPSDNFNKVKRRNLLALSAPFGNSDIALVKLRDTEFTFSGLLTQLIGEPVGVVRGYQNTPEFDGLMDKKMLSVVEALDDTQQLRLLFGKRVKMIIGDPNVFSYITSHTDFSELTETPIALDVISPPLQSNQLYFALSVRRPNWQTLITDINTGVAKANAINLVNILQSAPAKACNH